MNLWNFQSFWKTSKTLNTYFSAIHNSIWMRSKDFRGFSKNSYFAWEHDFLTVFRSFYAFKILTHFNFFTLIINPENNTFWRKNMFLLKKISRITTCNIRQFSSKITMVDILEFQENVWILRKCLNFQQKLLIFAQKTSFFALHTTDNRFLALTSLKKVVETSKHHFWEVCFWRLEWNFKCKNDKKC